MIGLGKLKKEAGCFLALDVGTEAVKAMVFKKDERKYFILGAALRYFDESSHSDNNKVILNTAEEALRGAGESPKELLLGLPPNVLRSRVASFEFIRKNPEAGISKEEAKTIIEASLKEIQKGIVRYFSRKTGIMPQDIQFIGNDVLGVKIDGYDVPDIFGYRGKKIWLKMLASFLPSGCIEKFSKIFNRLNLKCRIISPIKNLGILFPDDAIFADIGGEVTQICLVRGSTLEAIDEFEAGGMDFSRIISQKLGMRSREARFFKERYSMGDLTEDSRERIQVLLSPIFNDWKSLLKSKLETINWPMPSNFFIFGGGSRLLGFEGQMVSPNDFKNVIDYTGCVNSPQFTNLIFIAHG